MFVNFITHFVALNIKTNFNQNYFYDQVTFAYYLIIQLLKLNFQLLSDIIPFNKLIFSPIILK